jgi:hypothetical protein
MFFASLQICRHNKLKAMGKGVRFEINRKMVEKGHKVIGI